MVCQPLLILQIATIGSSLARQNVPVPGTSMSTRWHNNEVLILTKARRVAKRFSVLCREAIIYNINHLYLLRQCPVKRTRRNFQLTVSLLREAISTNGSFEEITVNKFDAHLLQLLVKLRFSQAYVAAKRGFSNGDRNLRNAVLQRLRGLCGQVLFRTHTSPK